MSQESKLVEMANVNKKDHYINTSVKFHVYQPGVWKYAGHGPRLKLFRGDFKRSESENTITVIKINYTVESVKIKHDNLTIRGKEKRLIMNHIRRYRLAYIVLWLDTGMSPNELVDYFELIDTGRSDEVLKKIEWLK